MLVVSICGRVIAGWKIVLGRLRVCSLSWASVQVNLDYDFVGHKIDKSNTKCWHLAISVFLLSWWTWEFFKVTMPKGYRLWEFAVGYIRCTVSSIRLLGVSLRSCWARTQLLSLSCQNHFLSGYIRRECKSGFSKQWQQHVNFRSLI